MFFESRPISLRHIKKTTKITTTGKSESLKEDFRNTLVESTPQDIDVSTSQMTQGINPYFLDLSKQHYEKKEIEKGNQLLAELDQLRQKSFTDKPMDFINHLKRIQDLTDEFDFEIEKNVSKNLFNILMEIKTRALVELTKAKKNGLNLSSFIFFLHLWI